MFLVTTAVEEFWDKKQKILFLGEWCRLYNRKGEWSELDYEELEFLWDKDKIEKAYYYCDKTYEETLIELTDKLNIIHHINKDAQYYRIILGNWLIHFIHQLYDKYLTLKAAFQKYPELESLLLDESQHYVALDYTDFMYRLRDDRYQLQAYTQILKELNRDFSVKKLKEPIFQEHIYCINNTAKDRLYSLIDKTQIGINTVFHKDCLTITAPYFSNAMKVKLLPHMLKRRFRYVFDDMKYEIKIYSKVDLSLRNDVKLASTPDQFREILSKIIFKNLPLLFLEGFKEFREKVSTLGIKQSKAFFTANAMHSHYIFKFFIAERYKDTKVLYAQHGGGYGIHKMNPLEEYERSVSDIFYTWGWSDDGRKTRYIPHAKLFKRNIMPKNKKVLFAMNCYPRYTYRFCFYPISSMVFRYIDSSITFLKLLNSHTDLLIRIHPGEVNYKCFTRERIKDAGVNFEFDTLRSSFERQLENCYIFVADHLGTTCLEALAANKPTIIFINPDITYFRDFAKPYFNRLSEVNISHYSPYSAAEHLNTVYKDVTEWWSDKKVQDARREFVDHYARISDNWMEEWAKEFERVLAES